MEGHEWSAARLADALGYGSELTVSKKGWRGAGAGRCILCWRLKVARRGAARCGLCGGCSEVRGGEVGGLG